MQNIKIISEHKRKFCRRIYKDGKVKSIPNPVQKGYKRVMAIIDGRTGHVEILK